MYKREREEASDRYTGRSGMPERSQTEAMQTGSQEPSGSGATVNNFLAPRISNSRHRPAAGLPRDDTPGPQDGSVRMISYKHEMRLKPRDPLTLTEQVCVRIPAEAVSRQNPQVKGRALYGTDNYTFDSDVVAVLLHCGYLNPTRTFTQQVAEVHAYLELSPPGPFYPSTIRNEVRSRSWGPLAEGCSFQVVRCVVHPRAGPETEIPFKAVFKAADPTFTPTKLERSIATRSSTSHHDRRSKCVPEVQLMTSMTLELWLKYSMAAVADKGLKPSQLTSARLLTEVIYFETWRARYELSMEERPAPDVIPELGKEATYRFAKCIKLYTVPSMQKKGVPLPESDPGLEIVAKNLSWEGIQFNKEGVVIQGKLYAIKCIHFLPATQLSQSGGAMKPDSHMKQESEHNI